MLNKVCMGVTLSLVLGWGAQASAELINYTEEFSSDAANWRASSSATALSHVNTGGGPDGVSDNYATGSRTFSAVADGSMAIFARANDSSDSSGDAFVGDWISSGVISFSYWVRHDLPSSASFGARIVSAANFPGAFAASAVSVSPNTWTELTFDISSSSAQLSYAEGGDYNSIFSNIGNVQLSVLAPTGVGGTTTTYTFDVDDASVAVIPEPTSIAMLMTGISVLVATRKRFSRGAHS